jgi:hypothetical protein
VQKAEEKTEPICRPGHCCHWPMWISMYLQVTFHECLAAEVYKCMSPTVDEYTIRKVLCDRI